MGIATVPPPVKLFIAEMFDASVDHREVQSVLAQKFGGIDATLGPITFNFTEYYKDEMGDDLKKMYLTFEPLIQRDALAAIKIFTNDIERRYRSNGGRRLNLDPGYLAPDKLVLASTKDFYHRVYLSQGIFAEVTLHYRKGSYRYFSWTYPDYKEPSFLEFLEGARAGYMKEVRNPSR
ncbi:MAG TPA: DUF4416 family protein [Chitinivibrionales bacterium]|nr:DUF4416 family protein [Chitinivibrionales bacterium]